MPGGGGAGTAESHVRRSESSSTPLGITGPGPGVDPSGAVTCHPGVLWERSAHPAAGPVLGPRRGQTAEQGHRDTVRDKFGVTEHSQAESELRHPCPRRAPLAVGHDVSLCPLPLEPPCSQHALPRVTLSLSRVCGDACSPFSTPRFLKNNGQSRSFHRKELPMISEEAGFVPDLGRVPCSGQLRTRRGLAQLGSPSS